MANAPDVPAADGRRHEVKNEETKRTPPDGRAYYAVLFRHYDFPGRPALGYDAPYPDAAGLHRRCRGLPCTGMQMVADPAGHGGIHRPVARINHHPASHQCADGGMDSVRGCSRHDLLRTEGHGALHFSSVRNGHHLGCLDGGRIVGLRRNAGSRPDGNLPGARYPRAADGGSHHLGRLCRGPALPSLGQHQPDRSGDRGQRF